MISAVTFDFWETLVEDSPENLRAQDRLRIAALWRALERAGMPLAEAALAQAYRRSAEHLTARFWDHHRDLSAPEQVRVVLECCAPGAAGRIPAAAFDELVEGYISPVLAHMPALSPGAASAIRDLAAQGLTLGIISNTGRTPGLVLRRVLERHDVLRHFAVISYSDEIGFRKPDPTIFEVTLARAGVPPAAAAHVGDNPVDDVAGARAVGMRAVHYAARRSPAAEADLAVGDLADLPRALFRVAS